MSRAAMKSARLFRFFKLSIALTALASAAFYLSGAANVSAQKRKPPKKTVNKIDELLRAEIIEPPGDPCIPPPDGDYFSVLQIDKNSGLTLGSEKNARSEILFSAAPMSSLSEVLSRLDKTSVIIFNADPAVNFGLVVKTLAAIRQAADACVNIEASTNSEDQYVYFPPEPKPTNEAVYPNPLTLIVKLDKNMNLSLNNEPLGTLADTAKLTDFLKKIFGEREKNGVFREGTYEIEKTLFVKSSPSVKFGDVIKIVDAVKEAGAFPVGLQIDNLGDF